MKNATLLAGQTGSEWQMLLWYNPSDPGTQLTNLPLYYSAVGTGMTTMRSSWQANPDTVFASVSFAGWNYLDHQSYDAGSLLLQRGDDKLLVHQNMNHHPNRHNTIVFNGSYAAAQNPAMTNSTTLAIENQNEYFYVKGEVTNAYKREWNEDITKLFARNVMYIRPDYLVVYDVTRSNTALGNLKEWYTQYTVAPAVDSVNLVLSATVGSSKVFTKTLYPVGGMFISDNPATGYYRAKYTPSTLQEYDQFLHVIEATASNASQTTAEKVQSSEGSMIGAYIHDSSSPTVVMFSFDKDGKDVSSTSTVTYAIDTIGEENTRHIVVHLSTGTQYTVQVATAVGSQTVTLIPGAHPESGTVYTTSNQGVLYFLSAPGIADTAAPTTTARPAGGTYAHAQDVTLSADEPATIYYTVNGSTPTVASSVYSVPIHIAQTTTLKYFAKDTAGNSEQVKTAVYIISAEDTPPTIPATPVPETNDNAVAWPVPFVGGRHSHVNFENIVPGSMLEIYTLDGQLVKSVDRGETSYSFMPNELASGTYLYIIKGAGGMKKGRFVVVK